MGIQTETRCPPSVAELSGHSNRKVSWVLSVLFMPVLKTTQNGGRSTVATFMYAVYGL